MTRSRLILGLAVFLVFLGLSAFDLLGAGDQVSVTLQGVPQQPPVRDRVLPTQVGKGAVRGRVIDGQTGAAIARARVRLNGPPSNRPSVLTSGQGVFAFTDLPPGGYSVAVDKATYMTGSYPDRTGTLRASAARPIILQGDQVVDNIIVRLYHGGAITGRVTDAHGDPLDFAQVSAMALTPSGAGRGSMRGGAQTNDIGEFRIGRLPPGRYVLMVSGSRFPDQQGNETTALPQPVPTYFPNALSRSEAQPISVSRGQTVSGAEIVMAEGVPTIVTGRVMAADGQPVSPATGGAFVNARSDDREFQQTMPSGASLRPDGTFRMLLAPGNYILEARRTPRNPQGVATNDTAEQFGMTKISVSGETMDVSIVLGAGATAAGKVVFEGNTTPPTPPPQASMPFSSPDGGNCRSGRLHIAPDWTFNIEGLMGTCSPPTFSMFGQWTVKSIIINNQDVTRGSLVFEPGQQYNDVQIVVTDRRNEINLHVTDDQGQPTRDYAVLVFPIEKAKWESPQMAVRTFVPPSLDTVASLRAMASAAGRPNTPAMLGREVIPGLMAGEYYAIALDDIESEASRDPAVLERLAIAATRVALSEGTVDVNLPRMKLNDVIR